MMNEKMGGNYITSNEENNYTLNGFYCLMAKQSLKCFDRESNFTLAKVKV